MQNINPIERSLLNEIRALYKGDLEIETHAYPHTDCAVCSKLLIIDSIEQYFSVIQSVQKVG